MPEISVVIPTYKRPDLLLTCLQHLELQTLDKALFEVLVVSDGPDEKTRLAVDTYNRASAMKIIYLSTPEKKGPAAARNMGWRNALSPLIAFTDDDCRPETGWLLSFINRFGDFTSGTAVVNQIELVFSGYTSVPIGSNPTDHALNTHGLQKADFITANCACTLSALETTGGFDERYGTAWREDSDLEFNFINHGIPIIKVMDAVVVHPVREAPWGFSIREQKKGQYDALLYKKYPGMYRRRLSPKIIFDFYFIMLTDLVCLVAIINGWWYIAAVTFLVVLVMIAGFFLLRIKRTKKTASHIWEMLVTSMVIPFLSVYWRIYGALKYRVLFI
jgi:glycosyltransferase involved in cell wall biosynthesis